ncbi:MAG: DUF4175 domain-containing protein, partial [Candidatus Aminicenantales bacterium]
MSNRDEGLEQKLRRLLDDLRNFKIANPEAQQQMQNMLERLNMLRDRHLGPAEQGLTRAGKSLEQIAEPPPGSATPKDAKPGEQTADAGPKPQPQQSGSPQDIARRSLAEAKTNQKAIADELQKMLESLGEFETYRGVVKDAQTLLKKQEEAIKQAAEAATKPDLMGKSADSLAPEQKADLGNLAARQSDLAKGLQNLLERMDDLGK